MNNTCISCGTTILEGRLFCPNCDNSRSIQPDAILQDGTPLYLKTRTNPTHGSLQLYLYDLLNRRNK